MTQEMVPHVGPTVPFCDQLHSQKYRLAREDFRESQNRISGAMSDNEAHFRVLQDITQNMRFMFAGRQQRAVGAPHMVTPYNCFVMGTIEDSLTEGHGSIMSRATEAAETMRSGGGIGYDFSPLRPNGAVIKTMGTRSSGPISFMGIYDAVCRTIASAGDRRGAQMAVMRVDHPDIIEFINAKHNNTYLTGFNMSVGVTDNFMECLANEKPFKLQWGGSVYEEVDAGYLWDMLMRSNWDWAEPGVLFIDTINRMNNLWYCETIAATNPCGEQPLPPNGACLLGSYNLTKYITSQGTRFLFEWDQFGADIEPIVRAMDNVIDIAKYPLYEQSKEAKSKRRMGIGITGLANAAEALGYPYGSKGFLEFEDEVLERLKVEAYSASVRLAREKGAFPLFDADLYTQGNFIRTLPKELQGDIRKYGIRNSHLTSIAPTGTISLCADNVSSGIEPVFAYRSDRTLRLDSGVQDVEIEDYGLRVFGVKGKRSKDVTVQEHLDALSTAVMQVDSSVSKTCNMGEDVGWDEFVGVYKEAWVRGCKGCTTFRPSGLKKAIMVAKDEPEGMCYVDNETGRKECE